MSEMSEIDDTIVEVLRLDEEATPGPWDYWFEVGTRLGPDREHPIALVKQMRRASCPGGVRGAGVDADAALITYYRTAAPALAREVQRLQIILEACDERSQMCLEAEEEADAELSAALDEIERLRACALPSEGAYIAGRVDGERIGFRAGQEAMRERCMKACEDIILFSRSAEGIHLAADMRCMRSHLLQAIRALEVSHD